MSAVEQRPFDGILTKFLEDLQGRCTDGGRPRFAPSTALAYKGDARGFCLFLEGKGIVALSAVTKDHITGYGQSLAGLLTTATQFRKMSALKTFLGWAAQAGKAGQKLADQVCYPSLDGVFSQPFLTLREVEGIILAAARPRQIPQSLAFRDSVLVAVLSSGASSTEAVNMNVFDVAINSGQALINLQNPRSGKLREIELDPLSKAFMILHLERYSQDSSKPLIPSSRWKRLTRAGCWEIVKELSKGTGAKPAITPDRLRYASVLRGNGKVADIMHRLDINRQNASRIAKQITQDFAPQTGVSLKDFPGQNQQW